MHLNFRCSENLSTSTCTFKNYIGFLQEFSMCTPLLLMWAYRQKVLQTQIASPASYLHHHRTWPLISLAPKRSQCKLLKACSYTSHGATPQIQILAPGYQ